MYETEYLQDPHVGLDHTGRKVNFRYVPDMFCPFCGRALEYLMREDSKGRRLRYTQKVRDKKRKSHDAVKVDRTVQTSKYESKIVGQEWLHEYKYICHNCGCLTESHAHLQPKCEPQPLPFDYYIDPLCETLQMF